MRITRTKLQKPLRVIQIQHLNQLAKLRGNTERRKDSVETTLTNNNNHPLHEKLKQLLKVQSQKPSPDSSNIIGTKTALNVRGYILNCNIH